MGDRVVDCARLESVCAPKGHRGFESLPIRQPSLGATRKRRLTRRSKTKARLTFRNIASSSLQGYGLANQLAISRVRVALKSGIPGVISRRCPPATRRENSRSDKPNNRVPEPSQD